MLPTSAVMSGWRKITPFPVLRVLEYKDQRYFVCELIKDTNKLKIVRHMKELQFEYRGRDVILKILQLELGEIIARLNPVFSLKL